MLKFKSRRSAILHSLLAISILGIWTLDVWLGTCGFDGCPSPREIQTFRPDQGGLILDRYNRPIGRLEVVRRINVPVDFVPQFVQQAFIATEDRRFFEHNGLDWRGFARAVLTNLKAGRTREGFSTITMQVARNTFAVRKYPARSLRQKLSELRMSRLLERSLTKKQILELYFNVIYMGNGVYGVEAASRDLFGRSVSQLNMQQAAMLAALPKAPSAYTPRRHPREALQRRNLVLSLMVQQGFISANRLTGLQAQPLRIARDEWRPKDPNDSYALDAVRTLVDSIIRGGTADIVDLRVRTYLDRTAQLAADKAVRRQAGVIQSESGRRALIQGAMVAIDPRTGEIRALTGGRTFERGTFNRALSAHRQPGSAFKPFVYAAAMAAGYSPSSEVDDDPIDVIQGRNVWSPSNYNNEYSGRITFMRALIKSANAATVRVSQAVGIPRIIDLAHRNGIVSELPNVPSMALGSLEVTPIELVTAYAPFANGGFRVKPRLLKSISTSDEIPIWSVDDVEGKTQLTPVMDPKDAYELTSMLQSVVNYGTGRVVHDNFPNDMIAGKTGTTNSGTDVWFVGYTPTVIAAFWFGFDTPASISGDASGGRLAAPAWVDFYKNGWKEKAPANAWGPPPGMISRTIDPSTGYLYGEWCPASRRQYYKPGAELPTQQCPNHGPDEYEQPADTGWQNQRDWSNDFGKKVEKALGKIFRF
ncbi:MAG TPA: PBP1A family penicillin-binding protein [Gemmatimonadaceae bacterium]|nr:PBP1A family penicillin-binding protein [Gemmatimonadaceae bacterium]